MDFNDSSRENLLNLVIQIGAEHCVEVGLATKALFCQISKTLIADVLKFILGQVILV